MVTLTAFGLHFTKIFFICHFHLFFSMHMAFQLTYFCVLIISSNKKGRWKNVSDYFHLFAFWKCPNNFSRSPAHWRLATEDRGEVVPQHSNLQWSSEQWPSFLFCVFSWLAVSFPYVHHYLGASVSDWRSFSKFPDLLFTPLGCFICIILQCVDNACVSIFFR